MNGKLGRILIFFFKSRFRMLLLIPDNRIDINQYLIKVLFDCCFISGVYEIRFVAVL